MSEREPGLRVRLRNPAPIALDMELACAPGEVAALVGPSGSGKSSVLRAIAGLWRPAAGEVRCGGELWYSREAGVCLPPRVRRIGMVFQHYALFPHLCAQDNIIEALGELPRARRAARARELLDRVRLAGLELRRPAQLSGGQQQRVAVARALARDPNALLLDEPFSAVDRGTRERLYQELAQLRRALDMPVVLVTHDLEEALLLADRITILHHGRSLQSGAPHEVLAHPADVTVARLVGLKNIFSGELVEHRAGRSLVRCWGRVLEARLQPEFAPGARLSWVIPPEGVILHRRERASRGERENPVSGVVASAVVLGGNVAIRLALDAPGELPLAFSVPIHVARRNGIAPGAAIRVSLLAEHIHLMPEG